MKNPHFGLHGDGELAFGMNEVDIDAKKLECLQEIEEHFRPLNSKVDESHSRLYVVEKHTGCSQASQIRGHLKKDAQDQHGKDQQQNQEGDIEFRAFSAQVGVPIEAFLALKTKTKTK